MKYVCIKTKSFIFLLITKYKVEFSLAFILFSILGSSFSQTINLSGNITKDSILNASLVKVTGNVNLSYGVHLTFIPGTRVEFQGYYQIVALYASINAIGTQGDSITFTVKDTNNFSGSNDTLGAWQGLKIIENSDSSKFCYCKFTYCKTNNNVEYQGCLYLYGNNNILVSNSNFNHISGNSIFIFQSNAQIKQNTFYSNTDNHLAAFKATIWCDAANPYIFKNTFSNNKNSIVLDYLGSNGTIKNNTLNQNINAIYLSGSNPSIINNIICNNSATGLIAINGSKPLLIDDLFANNYGSNGGAISINNSLPTIVNNTICNNSAVNGGGIYSTNSANAHIYNTILWGNSASTSGSQVCINLVHSSPDFINCDIQGGTAAFGLTGGATFNGINQSNITTNPLFVGASGGAGLSYSGLTANWNINTTSPCINAGLSIIPDVDIPLKDLAGNNRISNAIIDLGAYENRIGSIQPPCADITSNTEWIADTVIINCDLAVKNGYTLTIDPGTVVQFQGYYKLNIQGTLKAIGKAGKVILFTVKDTNNFYGDGNTAGGWHGIRFDNSSGIMDNNDTSYIEYCRFENGKSITDSGGAIYVKSFNRLIIDHSFFYNNLAKICGAAICCDHSNINISHSTFNKNLMIYHHSNSGTAISCNYSNLNLSGLLIINNTGPDPIIITGSESVIIENSIIANNTGGGVYNSNASVTFINSDIVNNYTYYTDISLSSVTLLNSNVLFINSILRGNYNLTTPIQIALIDNISQASFINCNLQSSYLYGNVTFQNDIDGPPAFINPTLGAGSSYNAISNDWSMFAISPCINAGTTSVNNITFPSTDFAGNPRVNGGIIDIGAFENQSSKLQFVTQPIGGSLCEGDIVSLMVSVSDTATYQWQKDGQDIPGANEPVYKISSVNGNDEGNYICIAGNAYGNAYSNPAFLNINTAPEITDQPSSSLIIKNSPVSLNIKADGSKPLSYAWQKDGINLPDTTNKVNIDSFNINYEGSYICKVTNGCGSIYSTPVMLSLAPSICMVTVSAPKVGDNGHNLIVWNKESKIKYSRFNIYRESAVAGYYDSIGSVSYSKTGIFEDTLVNPKQQAYLYKITAVDSNNVETDINSSLLHKTIHLITTTGEQGGIQLEWDQYIGFPYRTYYIYRSSNGTDFLPVDSIASSTRAWTDDTVVGPNDTLYYYISVKNPAGTCYPNGNLKAGSDIYSQSVSNMEDNRIRSTGITKASANEFNLSCHPNPFNNFTTISYYLQKTSDVMLEVYNTMGESISILINARQEAGFHNYHFNSNSIGLSPGVYILKFKAGNIFKTLKLIKTE